MGCLIFGRSFPYFFLVRTQQCGEQLEILAGVEPFPSRVPIAADKNDNKLMIRLALKRLVIHPHCFDIPCKHLGRLSQSIKVRIWYATICLDLWYSLLSQTGKSLAYLG